MIFAPPCPDGICTVQTDTLSGSGERMSVRTRYRSIGTLAEAVASVLADATEDPAPALVDLARAAQTQAVMGALMADPRAICTEALSLVASRVAYTPDPHRVELVRSPARTLADGIGDCEDVSALLVAVLAVVGIPAVVVFEGYEDPAGPYQHAVCVAQLDSGPLVLDATLGPGTSASALYPAVRRALVLPSGRLLPLEPGAIGALIPMSDSSSGCGCGCSGHSDGEGVGNPFGSFTGGFSGFGNGPSFGFDPFGGGFGGGPSFGFDPTPGGGSPAPGSQDWLDQVARILEAAGPIIAVLLDRDRAYYEGRGVDYSGGSCSGGMVPVREPGTGRVLCVPPDVAAELANQYGGGIGLGTILWWGALGTGAFLLGRKLLG